MNPFTQTLLERLHDQRLTRFVVNWDELEALVIRVYKAGAASPEDQVAFQNLQTWLRGHYAAWRAVLSSYWPQTRAGGKLLEADPFDTILGIQAVGEIPGNWGAMQILPAAREALNQFLLDRIEA